uniref:Abasic site processing protein n=1 Tax=Salinispora arenicola (strain CNS-205) TaxID=391037 RepID=A8M3C5_SALAI
MCGRYATTRSAGDLSSMFESYDATGGRLAVDYNVAPTDPVPLVQVDAAGQRVLSLGRWGFVPAWSRSTAGAARMINARAETVATSRAFAGAFARRRCLLPADGWYEWVRNPGGKQAYYLTPQDGSTVAFAGIWSVWDGPGGPLLTCGIVTTAALGDLADVHDRMPLLVPPERWGAWLGPAERPGDLLAPPSLEWLAGLEARPVGPAVGDVRNDGPSLVERVAVSSPPGRDDRPGEGMLF